MSTPFPGMDPYLEHPVLWTGGHSRLINVISQQLAPLLRPRYVASIEERIVIDVPEHQRIPDVWIEKINDSSMNTTGTAVALAEPLVVEFAEAEIKEHYIEILDRYQDFRVATIIEVLSPSNKWVGPGRESYLKKQAATLASTVNLVEIDLLREGESVIPTIERLKAEAPCDYLISVRRANDRTRGELYPINLRDRLPRFGIPLQSPDPDVPLDLQAAFEQVYEDGSYMLRVRYHEPCAPRLPDDDQAWAGGCWKDYRSSQPELFGD